MANHDDINTAAVAVIGVVSVILTAAMVLLLIVLFYQFEAGQQQAEEFQQQPPEITSLTARQEAGLAEYRMIDPEKKTVAIPIRRAMDLVVEELSKGEAENGP